MSNRTFTMVKPDATGKGFTGAILDQIIKGGFSIKAMKWTKLTIDQAGAFYEVHKARPFYGELVEFMSSGPIVAAILEKENAVADFRKLTALHFAIGLEAGEREHREPNGFQPNMEEINLSEYPKCIEIVNHLVTLGANVNAVDDHV